MVKIKYLKAWGLWSHWESLFEFSDLMTVITGPNGAGKSSAMRILKWVFLGEPTGESFIFTLRDEKTQEILKQAEEGKAEVGLSNGLVISKVRRKGKTNWYLNDNWISEKADVPQEVTDALGIKKYTFGDFEAYLNFAFQQEAPFLISESPSVGAKVLGKLAGTEAIDLAIIEVNKRVHKARTERAQAEKDIERRNGELLDYMNLDDIKAALDACEFLMESVDKAAQRKDILIGLTNTLDACNDKITRLTQELTPFQTLDVCKTVIEAVEDLQEKHDRLKAYEVQLDRSNLTILDITAQLELYQGLKAAADLIPGLELKERQLTTISMLSTEYEKYTQKIVDSKNILKTLESLDVAKDLLTRIAEKEDKLSVLKKIFGEHYTNDILIKKLKQDLTAFKEVDVAASLLNDLTEKRDKLARLKDLKDRYTAKEYTVDAIKSQLTDAEKEVQAAIQEKIKAWEEAGGMCPTCGQPVDIHQHE